MNETPIVVWVRFLSWHLMVLETGRTLCGRVPSTAAPVQPEFPDGQKTCETCLRVKANAAPGQ